MTTSDHVRLLISCKDRPGVVAVVSGFLADHGLNIVEAAQHQSLSAVAEDSAAMFSMRVVFTAPADLDRLVADFTPLTDAGDFHARFSPVSHRKKAVIMVSREDHCLVDLLWRHRNHELDMEIVGVVSNHPDHADTVESLGYEFHHIPVTPGRKGEAEEQLLEILDSNGAELVILARYMQILSSGCLAAAPQMINIHHSFLPAFKGAEPYRQAYDRGVKLIGATAHYVTPELDAGPIISQDVTRIGHQHSVGDLVRIGRDIERRVLAEAVAAHLEDRVLLDGSRTIVF